MKTKNRMSDNPRQWTPRQVQHLRKKMQNEGKSEIELDEDLLVSIIDDGSMQVVWHLHGIPFEMKF